MNEQSKQEETKHDPSEHLLEPSGRARSTQSARLLIRRAKQASRRKFPAEEKIRILLEGVRGEVSVSELCRREGIHPTIYYQWLKDFMEAGKPGCEETRNAKRPAMRSSSCARKMTDSSSWLPI